MLARGSGAGRLIAKQSQRARQLADIQHFRNYYLAIAEIEKWLSLNFSKAQFSFLLKWFITLPTIFLHLYYVSILIIVMDIF